MLDGVVGYRLRANRDWKSDALDIMSWIITNALEDADERENLLTVGAWWKEQGDTDKGSKERNYVKRRLLFFLWTLSMKLLILQVQKMESRIIFAQKIKEKKMKVKRICNSIWNVICVTDMTYPWFAL